jgi:hypothetical protein
MPGLDPGIDLRAAHFEEDESPGQAGDDDLNGHDGFADSGAPQKAAAP